MLERAHDVQEAAKAEPVDLAETRASLAEAIWSSGGDRVRARSLAEEARAAFVKAVARYGGERDQRRLAALLDWLDRHAVEERSRLGAR